MKFAKVADDLWIDVDRVVSVRKGHGSGNTVVTVEMKDGHLTEFFSAAMPPQVADAIVKAIG